jgi:hypothetical protein
LSLDSNNRVHTGVIVSSAIKNFSTHYVLLQQVDFTGKSPLYSQSQKTLKPGGATELRTGEDPIHLVLNFGGRDRNGGGVVGIGGASHGRLHVDLFNTSGG